MNYLNNYADIWVDTIGFNQIIKTGVVCGTVGGIIGCVDAICKNKKLEDVIIYTQVNSVYGFLSGIIIPITLHGLIIAFPVIAIKNLTK